jgi:catechol 2,3-dioxygenase-like lactoylglutathione lyase family enzyme
MTRKTWFTRVEGIMGNACRSLLTVLVASTGCASEAVGTSTGQPIAPRSGPSFDHVGVSVADLGVEQRWYQQTLGFDKVVEHFELGQPPVRTVILQHPNGTRIELIERKGSTRARAFSDPLDATSAQGYGHWALEVNDLDKVFAALSTGGGAAVWPPAPAVRPGARFAYVKDPEGNLLELIQPPPASQR